MTSSTYTATVTRLTVVAVLLALVAPWLGQRAGPPTTGADAGVIPSAMNDYRGAGLESRQTSICTRWAQQSAVVNGTVYLYGGEATTSPSQTSNTWNNDFLALDLTKNWTISSPSLASLPRPSGPPAVALGVLWSSLSSLYLYGGEFSSSPAQSPIPLSLWSYDIASTSWTAFDNPTTSSGTNAPENGVAVQRAAEGAGTSVANLGRGWYFGGHQDGYTTASWSQSIPRIYLTSLLEYTFPGASNPSISSLSNSQPAGSQGAWRNITEGGSQASSGFPERADGVLLFVPGFGQEGILLGLAGGTNSTFTQLNVIDVYDIASSTWSKQGTNGTTPPMRVNPCAVVTAAPDGSSYNVLMYGGQDLIPSGSQTQYSDVWILTLPSFTWINVTMTGQSIPPARAGQTCNVWDGQMVVVGGYVGTEISCDSPGVYVFDLSSLTWTEQFRAISNPKSNPQSKQPGQENDPNALAGSYGYQVPVVVQDIIGGNGQGMATITAPAATASSGPLATGKPLTYSVPGSNGSPSASSGSSSSSSGSSGTNVAAIAAGTVAGVLAIVVVYLAICAFLYRKRLRLYQQHMETERAARSLLVPAATYTDYSGRSGGKSGLDGYAEGRGKLMGTAKSSTDNLMMGQEPTFVGIMLHPRRSLRVVNR